MEIYPNYTLFIQVSNFLILLFLLNIIVYRPIRGILNKRKEEISSTEDITQEWMFKADKSFEEFEKNLLETKKDGLKTKDKFKDEGMEKEREMLQETYSSVEQKIGKAREEIQERIEQARKSLQAEVQGFSHELAEKILGRGI